MRKTGGLAKRANPLRRLVPRPKAVRAGQLPHLRGSTVQVHSSKEYDSLQGINVFRATDGVEVPVLSTIQVPEGSTSILVCFTHFADLTSWELAQKLVPVLPQLDAAGVGVSAVGLGSPESARSFAQILNFPVERLYCDMEGVTHKALEWSPGFGEGVQVSAYAKLLPMLMGIGSPGTLQEVIRGYVGDKDAKPVFKGSTPFDILGSGYQRPFELATLRLFNMAGILPKWGALSPAKEDLLVQQGGTVAFRGQEVVFKHADSGILKYTDVDQLVEAVLPPRSLPPPS